MALISLFEPKRAIRALIVGSAEAAAASLSACFVEVKRVNKLPNANFSNQDVMRQGKHEKSRLVDSPYIHGRPRAKSVPTICPAKSANHGFQLYSRNLSTTIIKTEIYFCCIKFLCEMPARLVELLDHLSSASFER